MYWSLLESDFYTWFIKKNLIVENMFDFLFLNKLEPRMKYKKDGWGQQHWLEMNREAAEGEKVEMGLVTQLWMRDNSMSRREVANKVPGASAVRWKWRDREQDQAEE